MIKGGTDSNDRHKGLCGPISSYWYLLSTQIEEHELILWIGVFYFKYYQPWLKVSLELIFVFKTLYSYKKWNYMNKGQSQLVFEF